MSSSNSNRNNPELKEQFHTYADFIAILWKFHEARIQTGNLELAYMKDSDGRLVPFNAQRRIEQAQTQGVQFPVDIVRLFAEDVRQTFWDISARQFFDVLGIKYSDVFGDYPDPLPPIPDEARKFIESYVIGLFDRARTFYYKPELMIGVAIQGGTDVVVHLRALFDHSFDPLLPVIASKVRIADNGRLRTEIGLDSTSSVGKVHDYSLFDNSRLGLNVERLRELGYGDSLGCPASIKVTAATKDFLAERGADMSGTTMLEEYARVISEGFDHYIGEWYRELSPATRDRYLEPEAQRILSGTVLGEIRTRNFPTHGTHGLERLG